VRHVHEMEKQSLHSVLLLHDASEQRTSMERPATVAAVKMLLSEAKARNWEFVMPY
jgi:hypothetical protein